MSSSAADFAQFAPVPGPPCDFGSDACYFGTIFQYIPSKDIAASLHQARSLAEYFWLNNTLAASIDTRIAYDKDARVLVDIMRGNMSLLGFYLFKCTTHTLDTKIIRTIERQLVSAFCMRYLLDNLTFGTSPKNRVALEKYMRATPSPMNTRDWTGKQIVSRIAREFVGSVVMYKVLLDSYGMFVYYLISEEDATARRADGTNFVGRLMRGYMAEVRMMSIFTLAKHYDIFSDVDGKGNSAAQLFADHAVGWSVMYIHKVLATVATCDLSTVRTIDGKCTVMKRIVRALNPRTANQTLEVSWLIKAFTTKFDASEHVAAILGNMPPYDAGYGA